MENEATDVRPMVSKVVIFRGEFRDEAAVAALRGELLLEVDETSMASLREVGDWREEDVGEGVDDWSA